METQGVVFFRMLTALEKEQFEFLGKKRGVILTLSNIDPARLQLDNYGLNTEGVIYRKLKGDISC